LGLSGSHHARVSFQKFEENKKQKGKRSKMPMELEAKDSFSDQKETSFSPETVYEEATEDFDIETVDLTSLHASFQALQMTENLDFAEMKKKQLLVPTRKLTLQLVRENTIRLLKEENSLTTNTFSTEEDEIDFILKQSVLRLDWLNLGQIENLEVFSQVEELFLQHNRIQKIENFEDLFKIRFLALAGNQIRKVK
jgi:hypothetical protein